MKPSVLKKYQHQKLPKILMELELDDPLKQQLAEQNDKEILNTLISKKEYPTAVSFLAFGLPVREAIWWSYLCAHEAANNEESTTNDEANQHALQLTHDWVRKPSEALRQAAYKSAEALQQYTASSWCATAVYWSGGSIAPQGQDPVEPDELMPARAAINAISIAANSHDDVAAAYEAYLKRGLHIVMGGSGRV